MTATPILTSGAIQRSRADFVNAGRTRKVYDLEPCRLSVSCRSTAAIRIPAALRAHRQRVDSYLNIRYLESYFDLARGMQLSGRSLSVRG